MSMYRLYRKRKEISPYLEKDMKLVDFVFVDNVKERIYKFASKWGVSYPDFVVYVNFGKEKNWSSGVLTPVGGEYFGGVQIFVSGIEKLRKAIPSDTVLEEIDYVEKQFGGRRKFVYKDSYIVLQKEWNEESREVFIGGLEDYITWRLVYDFDYAWSYYTAEETVLGDVSKSSNVWVAMRCTNPYDNHLYVLGSHRARIITYIGEDIEVGDDSILLSRGCVSEETSECEKDEKSLELFMSKLKKKDGARVFPVESEEDVLLLALRLAYATG